jgi:hypothetical protein
LKIKRKFKPLPMPPDMTNETMDEVKYIPLDLEVLQSKKSSIVSNEESLGEITPIDWSDEVLSGEKKVTLE